jgi:phospholipase C
VTSLITESNQFMHNAGPFPCLSYQTLRDPLDAGGVPWRYYAPEVGQSFGGDLWNAFDGIRAVRYGSEWNTNVTWPETNVFKDITAGKLPSVSWVIPDYQNSDHPGDTSDTGPSWVAQVVNAIGNSPDWNSTAIVVTWDDWGGWYDHVAPTILNSYGYGFRVPLIVISPYAKAGYISHTIHDFGSILKFMEETFGLPSLGYADAAADNLSDRFDLSQTPLIFKTINAPLSAAHFLNDKNPPADPDDD